MAHWLLNEKLNVFGVLGCVLCITGSLAIVLHAPEERPLASVIQIWHLALEPCEPWFCRGLRSFPVGGACLVHTERVGRALCAIGGPCCRLSPALSPPAAAHAGFLTYAACAVGVSLWLIYRVPLEVQTSNVFPYILICSIVGSLSVVSCKALGVALKLTFEGDNQLVFPPTYLFLAVVAACVVTQMNYLNKALDLFNTAIVTPIYYVCFTTFTIAASMIMFREEQRPAQVRLWLRLPCSVWAGSPSLAARQPGSCP